MSKKKKSSPEIAPQGMTTQLTLGKELDNLLGPEKFKALGQDLAMVVAQHELTRKPEICEKVFRYMSFVIRGWNS